MKSDGSKAVKKRPWMKFYPQDWRGDVKLQSCSLAARGLWKEMMCIMHEADPYGYLVIGGVAVTPKRLAMMAGTTERLCLEYLLELGRADVFSRDERNVIFSRRMVRDEEKSQKGRTDVGKRWDRRDDDSDPTSHPSSPPSSDPNRVSMASAITPESRDQNIGGDDERTGVKSGKLISQQAFDLAEKLLIIAGHDPKFWPPGWCGAPMRVQTWLTNGWSLEVIEASVRASMARKRDGPPSSVQFFEKSIATEIARQAAPLPSVEAQNVETAPTRRSQPPTSGFATIAARLRAQNSSD